MTLYKLTDKDGQTRWQTQWGEGVTHEAAAPGVGGLCGPGWIHAYEHPLLAVLHDPIHGNFGTTARLWECSTTDEDPLREGQMKIGVRSLTTMREIPLPVVTTPQRVRYAILCGIHALRGVRSRAAIRWRKWARAWLSGEDRSGEAAWVVWVAWAEEEAAWVARVARVAWVARAGGEAARAVGWAAREVAQEGANLIALAEQAIRDEGGGA